jgi:hypothetical protein
MRRNRRAAIDYGRQKWILYLRGGGEVGATVGVGGAQCLVTLNSFEESHGRPWPPLSRFLCHFHGDAAIELCELFVTSELKVLPCMHRDVDVIEHCKQ